MKIRTLSSRLPPAARTKLRRAYYQGVLRLIPSPLFCRLFARSRLGYWPNLSRPRTFNEHVLRYKLSVRDIAMAFVADKYLVREFVKARLGTGYSADILRQWTDIPTATCRDLPTSYVVKASHGSGLNHVVRDVRLSDTYLRELLTRWSTLNHYWHRREWVYRHLSPRFYAEEYLGSRTELPHDYRAMVFNGRVEAFQVDLGKPVDHRRALFDRDWRPLPIAYNYPQPETFPERPTMLDDMIELAERLGDGFRFVRVDMYALRRRLCVGEMTFYPAAGFGRFQSRDQDLLMGELWAR